MHHHTHAHTPHRHMQCMNVWCGGLQTRKKVVTSPRASPSVQISLSVHARTHWQCWHCICIFQPCDCQRESHQASSRGRTRRSGRYCSIRRLVSGTPAARAQCRPHSIATGDACCTRSGWRSHPPRKSLVLPGKRRACLRRAPQSSAAGRLACSRQGGPGTTPPALTASAVRGVLSTRRTGRAVLVLPCRRCREKSEANARSRFRPDSYSTANQDSQPGWLVRGSTNKRKPLTLRKPRQNEHPTFMFPRRP